MSRLKKHVRNYTQVANDIINDKRLSLKAKGLYLFLVSKPENWEFSARLIATQNNDQKASINSALHELEDFGLLLRVACQGGYDYEIYDKIKLHVTENRLSRKSAKRLPKIDLAENRSSISNKEPLAIREEKRDINNNLSSPALDAVICSEISDYPLIELFLESMSKRVRNPILYKSILRQSLLNDSDVNHNRTFLAYEEFRKSVSISDLPTSVNVFDLIDEMYQGA